MTTSVHEADVCIVGAGVVGLMVAKRIAERSPGKKIIVVEAGGRTPQLARRAALRRRFLEYGENPWPEDVVEDQIPVGTQSFTMMVGGSLTRSSGNTCRMAPEHFKVQSLYGVGADWPLTYDELEPYYNVAESWLGVSGEPSPGELRSAPYPMPALPMSFNLKQYKRWAEQSGIPFTPLPQAKNSRPYAGRPACSRCDTCSICPTGAKYSPDFTARELLDDRRIELHDHVLVRRLRVADTGSRIESALAGDERDPSREHVYRAGVFVLAGGRVWNTPILLLSSSSRFPNGLANSSGLVGKYAVAMQGTRAMLALPEVETFFGIHTETMLYSHRFVVPPAGAPYTSFLVGLREAMAQPTPHFRDADGNVVIGDALLKAWRAKNAGGAVRVDFLSDVHPAQNSEIVLDPARKNRWGDPLPTMTLRLDQASLDRMPALKQQQEDVLAMLTKAGGKIIKPGLAKAQLQHEAGGARMGSDAATSVCNSFAQTHDHENLYIPGGSTLPTPGANFPTLTYVALALRSADHIAETALGAAHR